MKKDIKKEDFKNKEETAEEISEEIQEDIEEIVSEEENVQEDLTGKVQQELEEQKDKFLRLYAEFDNFRKRTVKEKTEMYGNATADTVAEILPVLDTFERAVNADCSDETYKKGMLMLFEQMKKSFEKIGVEEINALGEEFDPNFHNAIKNIETEEFESGKVCQVFQKGYKYKEKLIRPAMVAVAE
ncbi:MAG: nucleotide exchange factor GrpE [Oscillospiraceae bacterium]|jgi:molecular chaperone GrpE|nr:nucleotide exchange factor GrpE [Oscillospiraceae bacterium]